MNRYLYFVLLAALATGCANCGEEENNANNTNPNIITEGDMGSPSEDVGGSDVGSVDMAQVDMRPTPEAPVLSFDRPDIILRGGDSAQLEVMIAFEDEILVPEEVTWTSSDETLVTVSDTGVATAEQAEGTTTIVATTTFMEAELRAVLPTVVISPYRALSTGAGHSCAASEAGTLYCWGDNASRQGALPPMVQFERPYPVTTTTEFVRLQLGTTHSCGLDAVGGVWCWGGNGDLQAGVNGGGLVEQPTNVVTEGIAQLALGAAFTCAIEQYDSFDDTTAKLLCWGSNEFGQLGNDTVATETETPTEIQTGGQWRSIAAGARHACGIDLNGDTYCWGDNRASQLGDGTVMAQTDTPVALAGSYGRIAAGGEQTCAIDTAGKLFCWGTSAGGIGNGSNSSATPVEIATPNDVAPTGLAVGEDFACAVTSQDGVFCWGGNSRGQLGDGTNDSRDTTDWVAGQPQLELLDAGNFHICGLNETGDAFCWGANGFGQLGDGTTMDRRRPTLALTPLDPN